MTPTTTRRITLYEGHVTMIMPQFGNPLQLLRKTGKWRKGCANTGNKEGNKVK